jgi:hypothetical protein
MKRIAQLLCAIVLAASAAPAMAQTSQPSPDPYVYVDPAMKYTAPPEAVPVQRADVSLDQLGSDLQPVATWILRPGKEDARTIQLSMEAYSGEPSQWEGQFESQTHGTLEGTLIRNRQPMTLLNGMPAWFVEIAYGSGFDARKEYAVVWGDGQRGIVLAYITRMGDASADEAMRALKQVTAVRYPFAQP